MASKPMTYADSGVDIDAGDEAVEQIKSHIRRTYGPRVLGDLGGFGGCFRLDFNEKLFKRNYRDPVLVSCTDGVGSKVVLASQLGVYDTVGQDLVAMNVNDLIVQGAEPLFFLDYIGIHKVVPERIEQLVKGIADGCMLAGCSLIGGETAELPDLYKPGDFDLAGFAVGVCELKRVTKAERVEEGDVILGLSSSGIHSNGYSLVRAIVKQAKLDLNETYAELDTNRTLGRVLLEPTRIYAKQVVAVLRSYKRKQPVSGMAHITGSGLPGNLPRSFGSHLNAKLSVKSWQMPAVFPFLQKHGSVESDEMFKVFNMGIGYTMIVRPHFAESVLDQLQRMGEQVAVIGKMVKGTGNVILT